MSATDQAYQPWAACFESEIKAREPKLARGHSERVMTGVLRLDPTRPVHCKEIRPRCWGPLRRPLLLRRGQAAHS